MTAFDAICLGIIQGITEFLPISSSAHLKIFSQFFDIYIPNKAFDVFLNLGTVAALLVYFHKDAYKLFLGGIEFLCRKKTDNKIYFSVILYGTIPAGLILALIDNFLHVNIVSISIIAILMIIFSVILLFCDSKPCTKCEFSIRDSILIGLAQIAAIIPGISRLGACLSVSRYLCYSREDSFKFSMFLSAPLFIAASMLTFVKIYNGIIIVTNWKIIFIGLLSSFITGLLSVHLVYYFLKKHTFLGIIIYRIIFACFLLLHSRALF